MEHHIVEWSSCHGWLALGSHAPEQGQINFFTHTGHKTDGVPCARTCKATVIEWHPTDAIVATGWEDGMVILTSPTRESEEAVNEIPIDQIVCVKWNNFGSMLCFADKTGLVQIYQVDLRGTVNCAKLHDVQLKEEPMCMCTRLLTDSPKIDTDKEKETPSSDDADAFENAMRERQRKIGARLSEAHVVTRDSQTTLFVFGTSEGNILGVTQEGTIINMFTTDTSISRILAVEQKQMIVALTSDMMLYQILIASDQTGAEKIKVKLPAKGDKISVILADGSILVMASGEKELRLWDLLSEENYTLPLNTGRGFAADESINSVTYSKKKGMLSGGTASGKVATWRRKGGNYREPQEGWRLQNAVQCGTTIIDLKWSPISAALAVNTGDDITILQEDHIIVHMKNKVAAIQTAQNHFSLVHVLTSNYQDLKLQFMAKGIFVAEKQLVSWSADTVMTFDVQTSLATFQATSFQCAAKEVALYNQNLYCLEGDRITVRTLQGTVKQIISIPEQEGDPVSIDVNKNWMAIATTNGYVRIYDISSKEAKQEFHAKYVIETLDEFHSFVNVKLNSSGNKVACSFLERMNELSDKILIWDAEADNVGYFSFDKGMTDQQEYEAEAELAQAGNRPMTAAARKMEREQSRYRMMNHRPGALQWDETDPRFLVCECVYQNPEMGDNFLLSMFITAEHGILLQDLQKKSQMCDALIGVNVPHLFFLRRIEYDEEEMRHEKCVGKWLVRRTMREFAGLEQADEPTRKAMLDFCFYLTLGHMDEAFKAIKFIKSESVWEHMATMSVKTRRLDVASVCLGNMGMARGARALRRAQREGQPPAVQCATLAVQLGMLDEAEALYKSAGRHDLVNKMLQSQNSWTQAFAVAETHDRIHLRNTHYNYASYLEEVGAIEKAIEYYEKSETHNFEIPRMFVDNPKILESYVRRKRNPELQKWWARYLESIHELEGAVNFYRVANDNLSVVRILCIQDKVDEAAQVATESGDKAACYHLARTYEAGGEYEKAVIFYTKAHAFSSAIRLAKEHDMKDRLANLCLMAGGSDLVEAARYYEDLPGYAHKAVMLYHKAGMIGRALDLAFHTEQFSALDLLAKELGPSTDATTLSRAAEFFANNNNYQKAVELLCYAKDFRGAIELCSRRNVRMTDQLAELLTPTKQTTPDNGERKKILEEVAELCVQQGSYNFAAKKYTQAGDKLQAMRALIKSGDTAKIRFFANTARSKDIYLLAANYLQSTEWRGNQELVKDIENFYNKAQSCVHLANFYQTCAFIEVEDYHDFARAGEALDEAQKTIDKGKEKGQDMTTLDEMQNNLNRYQNQMRKFSKIKGIYESDPSDAVRQLQTLAEEASEDDIIRPSHIFALLIGHHAGKQNWSAAYRCIQQLQKQQPTLDISTVVDTEVLDKICDQMKVDRVTSGQNQKEGESDHEEEVDFSYQLQKQQEAK